MTQPHPGRPSIPDAQKRRVRTMSLGPTESEWLDAEAERVGLPIGRIVDVLIRHVQKTKKEIDAIL